MIQFKTERYLLFGLFLIIVSTIFFLIPFEKFDDSSEIFPFTFFVHYSLPIIFFLFIRTAIKSGFISLFGQETYSSHIILLVLFNLSAYSLNRGMIVFYESATWLSVLLVLENIVLIALAFVKETPRWLRIIFIVLAPILLAFHLHQIFIVLPLTMFGFIGALFLGIGLLLFIPFFYLIALIKTFLKLDYSTRELRLGLIGLSFLIITLSYYLVTWNKFDNAIENGYLSIDTPFQETDLPEWIRISKLIKDGSLAEAYIKSDLVYQQYKGWGDSGRGFNRYNEKIIHDPIISICMGFGKHAMDEQSRIKVLNFLYNKRHQTADRFWRGNSLNTDQVVTNVQVFPEERLTYSELLLTISNQGRRNRRRNQQEAVYTFQLPEGSVITSLSLWVAGKEEKAILTTKSKAENAYNTIVGRERRDPSVIYWMEGNKARIRVFPCTPEEKRKIRVGVTAPMKAYNQKLHYESITFEGPDGSHAKSQINIVADGLELNSNLAFNKNNQLLSWKGKYQADWTFNIPLANANTSYFTYKNQAYVTCPTPSRLKVLNIQKVYLDITSHWSSTELKTIRNLFKDYEIEMLEGDVSANDYPNFTLFPYQELKSTSNSIVITKGGMATPNLEDLKSSEFHTDLFRYFENITSPPLVLDFGNKPSDFNKSLKEFGVLSHHLVSLREIARFVKTKEFPDPTPSTSLIDLIGNGLSIKKTDTIAGKQGSDHLMRLFYYQAIMNEIGSRYFANDNQSYIEEELTQAASIANVVTPLSSLIVLETQKDYERFDIERNKDSLGNASIKNQGAVPEPHEWALIILGTLLVGWFYFRQYVS